MAAINKLITTLFIMIIQVYRFAISGFFGNCCRFEPSCSTYAIQAIKSHGCLKGCWLAFRRLLRCHPWHAGGMDSVP
jgi:putative membrane protein insertion efficiency factor